MTERRRRLRRLEHVAQEWEPILRVSDVRHQKVGAGRVTANERGTRQAIATQQRTLCLGFETAPRTWAPPPHLRRFQRR